jgi:hypothetical protein
MADVLANCTIETHQEFVWIYSFQSDLKKIVNDDLMNNNPDYLFEEYKEYFLTKNLPTKTIDANTVCYRGWIGNEIIYGAEDDHNRSFILPYYRSGIEAPPPIYTEGGRFNRQGISYLYLADTVETCLAEGHNIVCFDPTLFELIEYSERIYTATKIKYNYQQVKDSIREYAKKSTGKYIGSYNEYEDEKNNKKFEYLNDWIENESEKIKRDTGSK